jgi:glutamate carboxypeptidase
MVKINEKLPQMLSLLERWVNINTFSKNPEGIKKLVADLKKEFQKLHPDELNVVHFDKSQALFLKKRKQAPLQIYFGGHLDTVFPPDQSFQKMEIRDKETITGPGVTDMKGGLVVLLTALEAFEQTEHASFIGWEIFINSDEEMGSPESTPFIESCAERCHLACLFEPALEDGSLVSKRKGSSNYVVSSQGKKAHAGRNPFDGKNAIFPLARFLVEAEGLNSQALGTLVNVGVVKGGEAHNIVPDFAECHLNVRADELSTLLQVERQLESSAATLELLFQKTAFRPPKHLDAKTASLFQILGLAAKKIGLSISWKPSGGVCDGNTFAAKGKPALDTLGVCGGMIHTFKEFLHIKSLTERTELCFLFLEEIASNKLTFR